MRMTDVEDESIDFAISRPIPPEQAGDSHKLQGTRSGRPARQPASHDRS